MVLFEWSVTEPRADSSSRCRCSISASCACMLRHCSAGSVTMSPASADSCSGVARGGRGGGGGRGGAPASTSSSNGRLASFRRPGCRSGGSSTPRITQAASSSAIGGGASDSEGFHGYASGGRRSGSLVAPDGASKAAAAVGGGAPNAPGPARVRSKAGWPPLPSSCDCSTSIAFSSLPQRA